MPGFAQFYSATVYPFLAGTLGRFCSLFPFSLSEIGLYFLCLLCICYMILHIRQPVAAVFPCSFSLRCPVISVHGKLRNQLLPGSFSYEAGIAAESSSTEEGWRCAVILPTKSTAPCWK
ncbi:MAG: DUF3810 family protein [Enterocloster clostridioformis]